MTGFISAKEYADKYGLQRTNVLKMFREGRIPAEKIGNQWVVPADAPPPVDLRVKSGKYKGWRQKLGKKENTSENNPEAE